MSYPVIVLPAHILCGKCQSPLRWDNLKKGATSVTGCCMRMDCEQYEVPLVFPLTVMELEKA